MNFSIQPNATLAAIMANGTKAEFNIDTCLNTVKALQVAYPEANLTLKLNLAECYQYCGKGFGHYEFWGVVDALTTWVFPLLNLLGNVCFTPTSLLGTGWKGGWGYSNFVAVDTHLLANPLDAIYNLASKLDVGRRIRKCCDGIDLDGLDLDDQEKVKVRRDIANVCYALDDFGPDRLCDRATKLINSLRYTDVRRRPAAFRSLRAIRAASYEIALARENNALHSALAIILYGVLVFAALLKTRAEGGVAYHQPHTIALRELYYWLLLSIILSSAAGRWSTQWAPYKSLRQLGYEIDASKGFELVEIEPWNGGNYVWRPYNNIFRSDDSRTRRSLLNPFAWALWNQHTFSIGPDQQTSDHRHLLHLFIAFLSLGASWALSFMISWRTPTVGIGGRGLCEMAFLVVWLASFMLTQWLGTRAKGRALFLLVWAIDTFISICAFLVLFVAFQGKCTDTLLNTSQLMFNRMVQQLHFVECLF